MMAGRPAVLALLLGCCSGVPRPTDAGPRPKDGGPGPVDAAADVEVDAICADADGDGFSDRACGGDDCDDSRADVYPGADDSNGWVVEDVADPGQPLDLVMRADGTPEALLVTAEGIGVATRGDGWRVDIIEEAGWSTSGSIAIDADGNTWAAWIAERSASVRVAHGTPGSWEVEIVGEGAGNAVVVIGRDLTVHVLYGQDYDVGHGAGVWLATQTQGTWQLELLPDVPGFVSGAVAGADAIFASVYDRGAYEVSMVEIGPGGSHVEPLGETSKWVAPIAWDPVLDAPWVAFDSSPVTIARWTGKHWATEDVPVGGSSDMLDLAIDGTGGPHLLAAEDGWDFSTELQYAGRTGGDWSIEALGYFDFASALTVDGNGRPHAIWRSGGVKYGVRESEPDGLDQNCNGWDF